MSSYRTKPSWTGSKLCGVLTILAAIVFVSYVLRNATTSHAEYLRDTYQIAADYAEAMDVLETAPPEVALAFAISAERVLSGPAEVSRLIACGEYRAVRARIRSMRRDLAEIQAYRASR